MTDTTNRIINSNYNPLVHLSDITKTIVESSDHVMDKCISRLEGLETKVGELKGKMESALLPASMLECQKQSEHLRKNERRKKEKSTKKSTSC